jgi:MarR family transcriptional regulator, temperature-dependent positive regulator of motility
LERERSLADARAKTVRLSPAGRAALDATAGPSAAADARLLALVAPKKRAAFLKILAALAAAADNPGEAAAKPVKAAKKKKKKGKKPKDIGA